MHLGEKLASLNRSLALGDTIKETGHPKSASKTEVIGTIIHSGFDILEETVKDGLLSFKLKKVSSPGPLSELKNAKKVIFKQPRIGRGGKIIQVLKLRTMYPMAHKAHEYFLKTAKIGPYGKPTDDYRVTPVGKLLRSFFVDELPQIVNILKGEMKLVGLRPLDSAFFKSLPSNLQQERLKHLPGLMAAIYADRPKTLEDRFASELKYLSEHQKHPFTTDLKYFFRILWSILFHGQRGV